MSDHKRYMELPLVTAGGQATPLFHGLRRRVANRQVTISSDELRTDPQTGTEHEPSNNFPVQAPIQNFPTESGSIVRRGARGETKNKPHATVMVYYATKCGWGPKGRGEQQLHSLTNTREAIVCGHSRAVATGACPDSA